MVIKCDKVEVRTQTSSGVTNPYPDPLDKNPLPLRSLKKEICVSHGRPLKSPYKPPYSFSAWLLRNHVVHLGPCAFVLCSTMFYTCFVTKTSTLSRFTSLFVVPGTWSSYIPSHILVLITSQPPGFLPTNLSRFYLCRKYHPRLAKMALLFLVSILSHARDNAVSLWASREVWTLNCP